MDTFTRSFHLIKRYLWQFSLALTILTFSSQMAEGVTLSSVSKKAVRQNCLSSFQIIARRNSESQSFSYEQEIGTWKEDLLRQIDSERKNSERYLKNLSDLPDQLKNRLFLAAIRKKANQALEKRIGENAKMTSETELVTARLAKELENLEKSKLGFMFSGSIFSSARNFLKNGKQNASFLKELGMASRESGRQFLKDIEKYKQLYGAEFFPSEGVRTAMMNVCAMDLFARLNGKTVPNRAAMNAIALLHPVTDQALDSGLISKTSLFKIHARLKGDHPEAETAYERLVLDLIDDVYRAYPSKKHPLLDSLLNDLNQAQVRSALQKGAISVKEANEHTIMKGGLSTSAFGYISLGNLTPNQLEFFFKGGAIYQWMDDFTDYRADMKEGINTLWTSTIQNKKNIEIPLESLTRLKDRLLENQRLISSFPGGKKMSDFFAISFYTQIITAAAKSDPDLRKAAFRTLSNEFRFPLKALESYNDFLLHMLSLASSDEESVFMKNLAAFLFEGKNPSDFAGRSEEYEKLRQLMSKQGFSPKDLRKVLDSNQ